MCTSFCAGLAHQSLGTLTADAEFLNKGEIFISILLGDVLKQALALADQLQQPAAGHEIVLVLLHMVRQLGNPGRHDTGLHRRAARILVVAFKVFSDLGLLLLSNHSSMESNRLGRKVQPLSSPPKLVGVFGGRDDAFDGHSFCARHYGALGYRSADEIA